MDFKKSDILIFSLSFFLLILSFFIVKSFIIPLVFTLILVYILNPVYKKLKKIFKNHGITSIFIITFFILLFMTPIFYSIFTFSNDFAALDQNKFDNNLNSINDKIKSDYNVDLNLKTQFENTINKFNSIFDSLLSQIPQFLFQIFIIIFFYYYFSKDYNSEMKYLKSICYGKKCLRIEIKLKALIEGVIYGQVLVRFIQALIGTLGFLIIGLNAAFLWGILIFFAAFLPLIGTGLIWGPLVVLTYLKGEYMLSLGVLIIGIIISTIDNFLLPYFISEKTNIGPVITLISIIGGLQLFGFYGIILGPFVLGCFLVLIEEILSEIRSSNSNIKKYIWSESDRKAYRKLKTSKSRDIFIEKMNLKYKST